MFYLANMIKYHKMQQKKEKVIDYVIGLFSLLFCLMSYFVILSSLLEINSYKNTTLLIFFPIFWIIIKIIYELFFYKAFLKYA